MHVLNYGLIFLSILLAFIAGHLWSGYRQRKLIQEIETLVPPSLLMALIIHKKNEACEQRKLMDSLEEIYGAQACTLAESALRSQILVTSSTIAVSRSFRLDGLATRELTAFYPKNGSAPAHVSLIIY